MVAKKREAWTDCIRCGRHFRRRALRGAQSKVCDLCKVRCEGCGELFTPKKPARSHCDRCRRAMSDEDDFVDVIELERRIEESEQDSWGFRPPWER